ncbi:hypothetical protein COU18_01370 [Candidatus Kaiserbacteria bacterium CG10_big_fil_rev_8_21_14_0_10_51_14]|uniref:Uncharacterized protein n=1 Tax=Candidatus Kaiserbacteria bacterium CG10_big_fil_rev_8_21_14_0_10_51_14 TaxID=1974610 RepID=A0A2H0UC84_9BACT|nr:MAG: hypothetical protein COU18_01370 [Candidatus Kaiserbacteria bacterium CG10_big_fil_rev_8_21_14_0_10_51_14]
MIMTLRQAQGHGERSRTMIAQALWIVFRKPPYALAALLVAAVAFAMAVWMPNLGLIAQVITDPSATLIQKVALPVTLLLSISTNFSVLSAPYTIAIPILFGVNVAMMIYYWKRRIGAAKGAMMTAGFSGMASGIFGIGCAACGSFLLTSILSSFGAAGALFILPLRGGEFGILGVVLLGLSIFLVAKHITNPLVCNTDLKL